MCRAKRVASDVPATSPAPVSVLRLQLLEAPSWLGLSLHFPTHSFGQLLAPELSTAPASTSAVPALLRT